MAKKTRTKAAPRASDASVIAVGSSDWHAVDTHWTGSGIIGDSLDAIRQIVNLALHHNVPLIAAGDLFDVKQPRSNVVAAVHEQMDRMRSANLPVYFTTGQHEQVVVPPTGVPVEWLRSSADPWPTHVDGIDFAIAGRVFYGLDWTPRTELPERLAAIPEGVEVLVAHQVWEEMRSGDVVKFEASLDDIPSHVTRMLTGDWHVHRQVEHRRPDGSEIVAWSPGSSCLTEISESAFKQVFLIKDDLTASSVPLFTRAVIDDEVDLGNFDRFLTNLPTAIDTLAAEAADFGTSAELAAPIVAVTITDPGLFDVKARVAAVIRDRAHLHIRYKLRRPDTVATAVERRSVSFAEAAAKVSKDPAAVALAVALYESADPAATLAAHERKFFAEGR